MYVNYFTYQKKKKIINNVSSYVFLLLFYLDSKEKKVMIIEIPLRLLGALHYKSPGAIKLLKPCCIPPQNQFVS